MCILEAQALACLDMMPDTHRVPAVPRGPRLEDPDFVEEWARSIDEAEERDLRLVSD